MRDFQAFSEYRRTSSKHKMQAMTEQAKDLTETATKAVMDSLTTPTKGGLSS